MSTKRSHRSRSKTHGSSRRHSDEESGKNLFLTARNKESGSNQTCETNL